MNLRYINELESTARQEARFTRHHLYNFFISLLTALTIPLGAWAGEPDIIFVPYAPKDLSLAAPAHENAHITLKGILRNADCNSGYKVYWDTNGNQSFDESPKNVSASGGTVYDIGITYKVPTVTSNGEFPIDVRVRNNCTNVNTDATYFLYVYDWSPSTNPNNWSKTQREVMVQMGIQEALWYIHRNITRSGSGNTMKGYMNTPQRSAAGSYYLEGSTTAIWAMNVNGRLPAYPPGTFNSFGHDVSQEWLEKNDERWNNDPYAETAVRLFNYIVGQGFTNHRIGAAEEENTCGIQNGQELTCNPIAGTDDRIGYYLNSTRNCAYRNGLFTGGISTALAGLAGTPLQVGNNAGQLTEYVVQQLVDFLGNMQIDGGGGYGGWDYWNIEGSGSTRQAYGSLSQWAYIGLESAEVAGKPFGVIVNNRHKYRIPAHLHANQGPEGGASYRTYDVGRGGWVDDNNHLTGGAIVANRWLEIDKMNSRSNNKPFVVNGRTYSDLTERQMVSDYNNYVNFIKKSWNSTYYGWRGSGRLWNSGTYTCDNTSSVYRWGSSAHCGSIYGIYSHQKGYRTGKDTLESIGGKDWAKEFETTMLRQQYRSLSDYSSFGLITDCPINNGRNVLCRYGGNNVTAGIGALILTPTIFNPKPIAKGAPEQVTVVEGCASASNGFVTFHHEESFHPNPNARIELYQWDVGEQDNVGTGRWWATGEASDFERAYQYTDASGNTLEGRFAQFEYQYMNRGQYTAQLRVVESVEDPNAPGGRALAQDRTFDVQVNVQAAENIAPSAFAGGPYILERGDELPLEGFVSDRNEACGDQLTVGWEFQANQSSFNDFNGATPTVPANYLAQFEEQVPHTIRMKVTDSGGGGGNNRLSVEDATTFIVYPREPVAIASVSSNPIACQQTVTFDGSASYHPNAEQYSIIRYEWDVDGKPGIDGGGALPTFSYTYDKFGTYPISLTVIDSHQERHTVNDLMIEVNQGNTTPVARIAQREYIVLENNDLSLSAAASYDSDINCGDSIVSYEWDLNGDGQFNSADGDIVAGDPKANVSVLNLSWLELSSKLQWPANRRTFEPVNLITLRVTDSFGAQSTATTQVIIFKAEPEAYFDQRPNPAPIDEVRGRVEVTLDARESYSPMPNGEIVKYEWDLNNDGIYDDSQLPVVNFLRIFPELDPNNIPRPIVRLKVTDNIGQTNTFEREIIYGLGDVPPTADADPSDAPERGYHILIGDPLILSAAQSIEPNQGDYIRHYRWKLGYESNRDDPQGLNWNGLWDYEHEDLDRDGDEAQTTIPFQTLIEMGYDALGQYGILMEVEDNTLLSSRDTSSFTIHPRDPIAAAVIDPPASACGQRVTLDGSASGHPHPGIDIVEWAWDMNGDGDFDDPEDARGERSTYVASRYTFDGPVTVTLRVTDSRGNQAFTQATLAVDQANSAPIVDAGGPYVLAKSDGANTQIFFDASGSIDANTTCDDAVVRYQWDLGEDGQIDSEEAQFTLSRDDLYAALNVNIQDPVGHYWLSLTVWDRFDVSSTIRVPVTIVNGPTAVARVVPDSFGCEDAVIFDGSASSTDGPADQGFNLVEYNWDFDFDGIIDAQGETVPRNYVNEAGSYLAGLIVIDASERVALGVATYELVIDDIPPIANAGGPYVTGKDRQNNWIGVDLDARASRDPNEPCDQITHYLWDTDRDGLYGRYDTNGAPGINGQDYEGPIIRSYVNPNWRVGSVQLISMVACDDPEAQHCSPQPAQVRVEISDNAPPAGEIISPRAGQCLNQDQVELQLRVRDPDGEQVRIQVFVDGALFTETSVQTTQSQEWQDLNILLNTNQFAEGERNITVSFTDEGGSSVTANAGGTITFDRQPPEVSISANLLADVCYRDEEVPNYTINAVDNVDNAPVLDETTQTNACERYLQVTATDACGNQAQVERRYRVAQPIEIDISGPEDGSLVAPNQSAFSWSFSAAVYERCVNQITATLSREGQEPWVYTSGNETSELGYYTFTLNVPTCVGDPQIQRRSFRVNGPPIAQPVSQGHPLADNLAQLPTYIVEEGLALRLEGDDSSPPEAQDHIAHYRWDLDQDGLFELEGAQVNFDTQEDGLVLGLLEVEDSYGLMHQQEFEILVSDVDPIIDAGGPYNGVQGQAINFDASLSRAANPSDLLSEVEWRWGDGSELTRGPVADHLQVEHIFDEDGQYEVTVLVYDEDSVSSQRIQVNVRDVHPQLIEVQKPNGAYALEDISFAIFAEPGAPRDEITSYDFDFTGNGQLFEYPHQIPAPTKINYQYLEAGDYEVRLIINDPDSSIETSFPFSVRPVTLSDLLNEVNTVVNLAIENSNSGQQPLSNRALASLSPQGQPSISTWVDQANWAEEQRQSLLDNGLEGEWETLSRLESFYRGNTLMAFDELLFRLNRAQEQGAQWGSLLWKISRQLLRETERYGQGLLNQDPDIANESNYQRGINRLIEARNIFENVDFKDRVMGRDSFLARDLFVLVYDAHFAFRHVFDLSTVYNGFPMPEGGDTTNRLFRANEPNGHVREALAQLQSELVAYLEAAGTNLADEGNPDQRANGIEAVRQALLLLDPIQVAMDTQIGQCLNINEGEVCPFLGEQESLELQLALMDLVAQLFNAADQGVFVRNAQKMLTLAVRFRVEVDLLRVERECGPFSPYPLAARAQQEIMEQLLDLGQDDAALLFYIAPERRCLAIEQYNECAVPAYNRIRDAAEHLNPFPYPEQCTGLGGLNEVQEIIPATPPIPGRPMFTELGLLFDISLAYSMGWDISSPQVLAQYFPERTWEEMNRDHRDQRFNISDYNMAAMQFNHDRIDYDQDGLYGSVEIDCILVNGMNLSVSNPNTQGQADGDLDCDGDGIPNLNEVEMALNPNIAEDGNLDTDLDGMSNYQEWYWTQQGLNLDIRDPSDAREDADQDGIINTLEVQANMDPTNPNDAQGDFDQDGLTNLQEVNNGLNPQDPGDADLDPDNDGLSSREEINRNRNPLVADCVDDPVELNGRDDIPLNARNLTPDLDDPNILSLTEPFLVSFDQGVICDAENQPDFDWYRFRVPQQGVRVVARVNSSDLAINLKLFDAQQGAIEQSITDYQDELIATPRGQLAPGEYLLRIQRDGNNAALSAYSLNLSLIPPSLPCSADPYEGANDNDQFNRASPLPLEGLRDGATWICSSERIRGDWYAIPVMNHDLTVHVGFSPTSDGLLALSAITSDFDYIESVEVNKTGQCITIRASQVGVGELVYLNVTASNIFADGDDRVDYTLQVVQSNLEQNARGACDLFNQGLYLNHQWPQLTLGN